MSQVFEDVYEGPMLYSERKDWADVTPIPQYEGVNPIAPIFYTPECESWIFRWALTHLDPSTWHFSFDPRFGTDALTDALCG